MGDQVYAVYNRDNPEEVSFAEEVAADLPSHKVAVRISQHPDATHAWNPATLQVEEIKAEAPAADQ